MGFFKSVLIDAVLFIALAGLFAQTGMFYVSSVGVALLAKLGFSSLECTGKAIFAADFFTNQRFDAGPF